MEWRWFLRFTDRCQCCVKIRFSELHHFFFVLLLHLHLVPFRVLINCASNSISCIMNTPYFCNMSAATSPCSLKVLTAFSAEAQTKAQKCCICLQYFSLEWLFAEHHYLKKNVPFQFILWDNRLYFKANNAKTMNSIHFATINLPNPSKPCEFSQRFNEIVN